MERDEKDSVERLKGRLYDRTAKTDAGEERTALSKEESSVPTAWNDVVMTSRTWTPATLEAIRSCSSDDDAVV